jgi:hypothetical protein
MLKCPAPGGTRFQQKGLPIIPGGIFFSTKILVREENSAPAGRTGPPEKAKNS